jgi:pectin methylesterase-like acyl-CoA thioesterase
MHCREKVRIPKQKGYILLEGEGDGSSATDISFDAHAHAGIDDIMGRPNVTVDEQSPTFQSATFTVLADNFVARGIAFKVILRSIFFFLIDRRSQKASTMANARDVCRTRTGRRTTS